jgi:hypothetical protein
MFASERPSWRNPRVLAILLLVFVSGAVCGGLTMRMVHRKHDAALFSYDKLSYDKLTTDLKLRPDQCEHLKQILADLTRYHQDLQAQLNDWQATGKDKILKILDADQRTRFEQLASQK